MTPKEEGLAGDVSIREVLDPNGHSLSTYKANRSDKSEAENGELQVTREFLIRARTVADTERVRRTFLPPILMLTFLPTDLNEMGLRRTPTKPTLHSLHPLPNPRPIS